MPHYKKLDNGKIEKTCPKCKKVFTVDKSEELLEFFYKDKIKKDGFISQCKICNKKACLKYHKKNWEKILLYSALCRAKKYGRDFDLTVEWILERFTTIDGKCENPECRKKLKTGGTGKRKKTHDSATLDRFDNEGGYTKDNVQFLCSFCNTSKRSGQFPYEREVLYQRKKQKWLEELKPKIDKLILFEDFFREKVLLKKDKDDIDKIIVRAVEKFIGV